MPVACRWCIILRTGFERWNLSREWGVTPSCDGHNGKSKWESGTWNDGYWKTSVRRAATHMIGIATLTWHPATMKGWNSAWISAWCGCSVLIGCFLTLLVGALDAAVDAGALPPVEAGLGATFEKVGKVGKVLYRKAESFRRPCQKVWMGVWINPLEVWLSAVESVNWLWMVESIWQVPKRAGVNAPPPFTELSLRPGNPTKHV